LQWLRTDAPSLSLGALSGLALAATCLTKLSNLPLVSVALAVMVARSIAIISRTPRAGLIALAALISCAAIPVGTWILWTKFHFGDVTGSTAKISLLGWTRKPFGDWWQHPIFSPHGLWVFWSDLIATFWRGEVEWHGRKFDWEIADRLYAVSSLMFILAAILGLRKSFALSGFQRQAIAVAILIFAAGVAFLGLLSIQFDFGSCVNPSRSHPYFTSGRLLSGAMIPFALTYVYGISCLCRLVTSRFRQTRWIDTTASFIVLGAIVMFSQASEIFVTHPVFASEHNWFHR
jgi:hypothetical protein